MVLTLWRWLLLWVRILVRESTANRASVPTRPSSRTYGTTATRCFEATPAVGRTVVTVLAAAVAIPIEVGALLATGFTVVSFAVLAVVRRDGGFSLWGRRRGDWSRREDRGGAGECAVDGDEGFCLQGEENVVDELLSVCVGVVLLAP